MPPTAERLKYLREREELTQAQLADKIGINVQTYKGYEQGRREMPSSILTDLCRFYNVSADFVLGLVDLPYSVASPEDETIELYHSFSERDKTIIRDMVQSISRLYKINDN